MKNAKRRYPVVMSQKVKIKHQLQEILQTKVDFRKNLQGHTGLIIPDKDLEDSTELRLSIICCHSWKRQHNNVTILAINLIDLAITSEETKM